MGTTLKTIPKATPYALPKQPHTSSYIFSLNILKRLIFGYPYRTVKTLPEKEFVTTTRFGFFNIPFLRRWIALIRIRKLFPVSMLRLHGYVVAKSGYGKSELLKMFFYVVKVVWGLFHWIPSMNKQHSFLFLDPHGEVANEIARQKIIFKDFRRCLKRKRAPNLVLISSSLGKNKVFPTLNPFDIRKEKYGDFEIEVIAQNLSKAFASMLSRGDIQLSLYMRTLLFPMLVVLLTMSRDTKQKTNMTFWDLERFFDNSKNQDLLNFGTTKIRNQGIQLFFNNYFPDPRFGATKFSLQVKLASLLNSALFSELLAKPNSTWDLKQALRTGKTVIVDCNKADLGPDVSEMFGRTITALAVSYAFMRGGAKQREWRKKYGISIIPTFLIMDEAATFISEDIKTILAELRKYGLHLLMVNQIVRQGGASREFHDLIMGNTAMKAVGNSGKSTRRIMADECDLEMSDLGRMGKGTFMVQSDGSKPIRARLPDFWIGEKTTMKDSQWEDVKNYMLAKYYRKQKYKVTTSSPPESGKADTKTESSLGIPRSKFF